VNDSTKNTHSLLHATFSTSVHCDEKRICNPEKCVTFLSVTN